MPQAIHLVQVSLELIIELGDRKDANHSTRSKNACLQGHFYDAVNWHTQAERLQKAVRLLRIL